MEVCYISSQASFPGGSRAVLGREILVFPGVCGMLRPLNKVQVQQPIEGAGYVQSILLRIVSELVVSI